MSYKNILFDLDGTIIDSGKGITNSVKYALKKLGEDIPPMEVLYKFIGPSLKYSFTTFCGFDQEKALKAVELYRETYRLKGVYENDLYKGIKELIIALFNKGKTICLATAKPQIFAHKILQQFELDQYFSHIVGATLDGSHSEKSEIIELAIIKSQCNCNESVMIGDREYDILGAKANNIDSIGVLYGYGSKEELAVSGATFIVKKPVEILDLVL